MHRDGKERRQIIKAMVQRQTRISKHPENHSRDGKPSDENTEAFKPGCIERF